MRRTAASARARLRRWWRRLRRARGRAGRPGGRLSAEGRTRGLPELPRRQHGGRQVLRLVRHVARATDGRLRRLPGRQPGGRPLLLPAAASRSGPSRCTARRAAPRSAPDARFCPACGTAIAPPAAGGVAPSMSILAVVPPSSPGPAAATASAVAVVAAAVAGRRAAAGAAASSSSAVAAAGVAAAGFIAHRLVLCRRAPCSSSCAASGAWAGWIGWANERRRGHRSRPRRPRGPGHSSRPSTRSGGTSSPARTTRPTARPTRWRTVWPRSRPTTRPSARRRSCSRCSGPSSWSRRRGAIASRTMSRQVMADGPVAAAPGPDPAVHRASTSATCSYDLAVGDLTVHRRPFRPDLRHHHGAGASPPAPTTTSTTTAARWCGATSRSTSGRRTGPSSAPPRRRPRPAVGRCRRSAPTAGRRSTSTCRGCASTAMRPVMSGDYDWVLARIAQVNVSPAGKERSQRGDGQGGETGAHWAARLSRPGRRHGRGQAGGGGAGAGPSPRSAGRC